MACETQVKNDFEEVIVNDSIEVELRLGQPNQLICLKADSIVSIWPLRYPVYQFQHGDINHDGNIDLAVGVVKATRYDPVKRKRLFLFQFRNNAIIPLWLGTSVGHPIVDFNVFQDATGKDFVRIICLEKNDKYLVADFTWYGFGLTLSNYVKRETTIEIAKELLYHHI